jgi:hypothetical protein
MLRVALLLSALICGSASAGSVSGSGKPDPYVLGELIINNGSWMANRGYTDANGRTARNLTINTGIKNLVLILAGQSLMAAEAPSAYTPTNAIAIDNFNIYDGSVYPWSDPPLGATWVNTSVSGAGVGSIGGRIADKFISAGTFDRVIVVSIAVGGAKVSDWATGSLSDRLCKTMLRLSARGFAAQTNVTVAIVWGQGEADTVSATGQSAYQTALSSAISNVQSCGFSGRFFVNSESWSGGTTSSNVTNAQAAVIDNSTVFAGGNLDSLNATNRLSDNTHLNDTGMANAATLIFNAMHASGTPF